MPRYMAWVIDHAHRLLAPDRIRSHQSAHFSDVRGYIDSLAASKEGVIDTFDDFYLLTFRMTLRVLGPIDIVEDEALLKRMVPWLHMLSYTSPLGVIFPRLPTWGSLKRLYGGARLYLTFSGIGEARRKTEIKKDDPMQYMLDTDAKMDMVVTVGSITLSDLTS